MNDRYDITTPESASQELTNIVVDVIADFNEISPEEALLRYQAWCKEYRERREKEEQERMTMEYGP